MPQERLYISQKWLGSTDRLAVELTLPTVCLHWTNFHQFLMVTFPQYKCAVQLCSYHRWSYERQRALYKTMVLGWYKNRATETVQQIANVCVYVLASGCHIFVL